MLWVRNLWRWWGEVPALSGSIAAGKLTILTFSVAGDASFGPAQRAVVLADILSAHVVIDGAGHFVAEKHGR